MAAGQLQKLLGKGFSIAACVGLVIGLGILRTPGEIATTVSDPLPYMALWIGCGLFVLLSLGVVAELIAATPRTGGIYAMVRHAYGPYPGFLLGWTDWISNCAALALKTVVLLEYMSILAPQLAPYQTVVAVSITTIFAALQLGGTKLSAGVQRVASPGMGLIIATLAVALFYGFFANGGPVDVQAQAVAVGSPSIAALGLVITAIVFTYDGWYAASYFSGEAKSGARDVAIGSLQAALIIMALYVLLNLALVLSVPLPAIAGHKLALGGALDIVFETGTSTIILVAAMFILLAHQNLQYMIVSRILYSISVDGLGAERATTVSERGTPSGAVIVCWLAVSTLIVLGQFELLLRLVAMLFMCVYVGLIVGVFRLRSKEPDTVRPFKAWGYPATGVFCAVAWSIIVVFVAFSDPMSALYGLVLVGISVPVYLWLRRHRDLDESASVSP